LNMEFAEFYGDAGNFKECVLCGRKLKQGSEYPIGVHCRKKLKKNYRIALLNVTTGCHEGPWVKWSKDDLKEHFGSSVDIYVMMDLSGTGHATLVYGDHEWGYPLHDKDYDQFEAWDADITGNEAMVIGYMIENGFFEYEIVHRDTNALRLGQHSRYIGPASSLADLKKKWGVQGINPSCYCGEAANMIDELQMEAEHEEERWSSGDSQLHMMLRADAKGRVEEARSAWNDICLLVEGTDWDSPVDEWLYSEMTYW